MNLSGLISLWLAISGQKDVPSQSGLRWLSEFTLTKNLKSEKFFEVELSLNSLATTNFRNFSHFSIESRIKPYRAQVRYSSSVLEARIGLQKITFGSAYFLRPLMWFDHLDPRDPLQITDGVYGLLLRYYFLSNTNLWFWGLYGNNEPKGWEILATARKKPEFGGRIQVPLGQGELGLSLHHRQACLNQKAGKSSASLTLDNLRNETSERFIPEDRFGLDGKWDIGIGLWFEVTFIRQRNEFLTTNRQRAYTIGLDYTLAIKRGLHILTEYFELSSGKNTWRGIEKIKLMAFSLSYPLNLIDNLMTVIYYDCQKRDPFLFFRWQRVYDRWNFHFMAFWNAEHLTIYRLTNTSANHLFSGKGLQLLVAFYY
ncbi:MAG: hypothetical protein N3B16_08355 [Candidatus Aminicenantes bacterium]|nr:hypothetical protein [Candidatus Aminicenantes bacterium]